MSEDGAASPEVVGEDLQARIVAFVRAFGLLKPDETPCGMAIPVSEAHAITALADGGPDGLTQTELGRQLRLTKSTVSRLVDQLVDRGWVNRRAGQADGRLRLVGLTPKGVDVARQVAEARAARLGRLLDRIPEDQRAAVLAALDALVEASRDD